MHASGAPEGRRADGDQHRRVDVSALPASTAVRYVREAVDAEAHIERRGDRTYVVTRD